MTRTASLTARVALATLTAIATTAPFALVTRRPDAAPPAPTEAAPPAPPPPPAAVPRTTASITTTPTTTRSVMTYLETPTDEQRQVVEWTVARYAEAGLTLPALKISFPATCGGKAGRYFVGQARIELCKVHRKTMMHELAHAWDDSTSLDRAGFLHERGLDHWYEQTGERSNESGGEQLALIITWGLMDVDLTHPVAEQAGQPIDEQPRRLPGIADVTPPVLASLFTRLTGTSPLTPSVNARQCLTRARRPASRSSAPPRHGPISRSCVDSDPAVEPRMISNARHPASHPGDQNVQRDSEVEASDIRTSDRRQDLATARNRSQQRSTSHSYPAKLCDTTPAFAVHQAGS